MEGIRVLTMVYFTVSCTRMYSVMGFKFTPTKVFFEESTHLTLFGEDLNTTKHRTWNVTVCQQPCRNITNKNGNITCVVKERTFNGSYKEACNITVSSLNNEEIITAEEKLKFVWPQFFNFTPTHGPFTGGATITFHGRNLNINRTILITVANVTCNINETNTQGNGEILRCNTGRSLNETACNGSVQIAISNWAHIFQNDSFCYHGDPIITGVSPNWTIQSGDTNLKVFGENLEFDVDVQLYYYSMNIANLKCQPNKANNLMCRVPNLRNMTVAYFENTKSAPYIDSYLVLKMDNRIIKTSTFIRIFRQPEFKNLPLQECSSLNKRLQIQGQYFSKFISDQVIVTTASNVTCQMQYIDESFMECLLNVNKTNPQGRNGQGNNSAETTTPESVIHRTISIIPVVKKEKEKSPEIVDITTGSSVFPKKTLKEMCPLTVKIGEKTWLLNKTELINEYGSSKILHILLAIGSVTVVLLMIVLILTVKLRRLKIFKKNNWVHSGSARNTCQTLKEILDSMNQRNNEKERDTLILDLDLLTVGKCIGSGNFGCVYEGLLYLKIDLPPLRVAIKSLQDNFSHNLDLLAFVQEALIMKDFQHPNVMGLVGLTEKEPGVPYVILPFMDKGDLLTYVRDPEVPLSLHDVVKFGADIANGMAYLSSLKLVHRDLAARNCMLDSGDRVKVADFGLCRDIYEKGYYTSDNKKKLPIRWMALESIEHGAYSTKSDVWSLGVVLWEMLTRGLTPYPGVDGWDVENFLRRRRLPPPYFCPESLYNLMMMCWANDPLKRPTFETIKSEILLLLGQDSSGISSTGPNDGTTMDEKVDSQSASGDACKKKKSKSGLKQCNGIQSSNDDFLNQYSNLKYKTPYSRKVFTGQETTLRQNREEESIPTKVFLSVSTVDGLEQKLKTDDSMINSGLSMLSCIAKPGVLMNLEITIPQCFSDKEVSKKAIEFYQTLIDNYEPPKKFTNPVFSLSRSFSKRGADKWRQDIKMKYRIPSKNDVSDSRSRYDDDSDTGEGGAYQTLWPRLSGISNNSDRSFTSCSSGSLEDTSVTMFEATTAEPSACKENDTDNDSSNKSPPRPPPQAVIT